MAGKKQHDLPRLLLRGFAEAEGEKAFLWQFRQDTEPKKVSIQDVGHSKFFYDKPGPGTLDAFITDKENEYGTFVARLRRERRLSASDEGLLIEFVHSLAVRTRNLRDRIESGVNAVLQEAQNIFTDASAARRWMLNEVKKSSPLGDRFLTDYIKAKYGTQTSQRENYLKWQKKREFKQYLLHNPDAEEILRQLTASTKIQFPQSFGQLAELAKTSHNNALEKVLQPAADERSPRYARYSQMRWNVQSLESAALILGDVAVLQFERKTGNFSAAFDGSDGDEVLYNSKRFSTHEEP